VAGEWIPLVGAITAALGSVGAAAVAARHAANTRASQQYTERLVELERRLAGPKADTYQPIIDLFGRMLSPGGAENLSSDPRTLEVLGEFLTWVQIYGSDEVVRASRDFMQAAYAEAPAEAVMRLYADFVLTIRRDVGHRETELTVNDLLALRIKDLYDGMAGPMMLPQDELFASLHWDPPWRSVGAATDRGSEAVRTPRG
jgi:hypothetical protein